MKIEINYPDVGAGSANHALVAGIVAGVVLEIPGRVPDLVEHCDLDEEDDAPGRLTGTATIYMQSGNRYRVHVEPLDGNVD